MTDFDAELREWAAFNSEGFVVIAGKIFGDRKLRWPDGRLIRTSPVLVPRTIKDGNVVATLNSHYLLVGADLDLQECIREARRKTGAGMLVCCV